MTIPTQFLPALVMLFGMGVPIAALYAYFHGKKRFNCRRLPFQDGALRPPGEALRTKIEDQLLDLWGDFMMVMVTPVICYAVHLQQKAADASVNSAILLVTAIFIVLWFSWRIVQRARRVTRLRIGYAGEVAVGETLNQLMLKGYRVFHDLPGDKAFNIDHVVVGPAGVFAVETKTRTKRESRDGKAEYKVAFDGKALSFKGDKGMRHTDFLDQAKRNAKWLSTWLTKSTGESVPVRPVLVLPGWYVTRTGRGDVLVMNHKEVRTLPKAPAEAMLGADRIQRIVHQLDQRCRDIELTPKIMRKEKEAFS